MESNLLMGKSDGGWIMMKKQEFHYNIEDFSNGKSMKAIKKVIPIDISYDSTNLLQLYGTKGWLK